MLVQELKDLPAKKVRVVFEDAEDLVLYRGEIRKYRIEEGEDLPEEEYHEIFYQVIGKRAKKRAMHLLEKMDRTESNLREKLRMNGYPQELVDEAVDYVKRYHYIDDRRYAENYVRFHAGADRSDCGNYQIHGKCAEWCITSGIRIRKLIVCKK